MKIFNVSSFCYGPFYDSFWCDWDIEMRWFFWWARMWKCFDEIKIKSFVFEIELFLNSLPRKCTISVYLKLSVCICVCACGSGKKNLNWRLQQQQQQFNSRSKQNVAQNSRFLHFSMNVEKKRSKISLTCSTNNIHNFFFFLIHFNLYFHDVALVKVSMGHYSLSYIHMFFSFSFYFTLKSKKEKAAKKLFAVLMHRWFD